MRKTLEDLYYGNIIPHEKRITAKSELQRMIKRAAECESKLTAMLNDEEKHTLNVLMSAQQEIDGITAIERIQPILASVYCSKRQRRAIETGPLSNCELHQCLQRRGV